MLVGVVIVYLVYSGHQDDLEVQEKPSTQN